MKIMFILCDMLRADLLQSVNTLQSEKGDMDKWFDRLGGTIYQNCYTPAPDTPRSLACLYTGSYPKKNGCQKRIQWPGFYLNQNCYTLWKMLREQKYSCLARIPDHYIRTGFLPEGAQNNIKIYESIKELNSSAKTMFNNDNLFLFYYLPDFHLAVDEAEDASCVDVNREGQRHLANCFSQIFNEFHQDQFDYIFVISDHGCKLSCDIYEDALDQLRDARTKIVMFFHKKGDTQVCRDAEICSIMDIVPTLAQLMGVKLPEQIDGISLLEKAKDRYIVFEDHIKFKPSITNPHELWGLRSESLFFLRSLDSYYLLSVTGLNKYETVASPDRALIEELEGVISKESCSFAENMKTMRILDLYNKLNAVNANKRIFSDGESFKNRSVIKKTSIFDRILSKIKR